MSLAGQAAPVRESAVDKQALVLEFAQLEALDLARGGLGQLAHELDEARVLVGRELLLHEGRALLTGLVQDEKMRADAVGEAWKIAGVKQVLNEIEIAPSSGVVDYGRDTWITTQIKSKLAFDEKVMAVNFNVQTINGTVYLLGIARGADEHRRVIDTCRSIGYVRRVVDHVRVKQAGGKS